MKRLATTAFLLAASPAAAGNIDGVAMPESWEAAASSLVLNGMALRTYSFLSLHIYVAGLYLQHRSADPDAILGSGQPKLLRFVFLRDVAQWAARRSWRESLDSSCRAPCGVPAQAINRFLDGIQGVHAGDTSTFLFTDNRLEIAVNGRVLGRVEDPAFERVILATFIGPHPTAADVKRGLLGVAG